MTHQQNKFLGWLESTGALVCLRDDERIVEYQNPTCKLACGDQCGRMCARPACVPGGEADIRLETSPVTSDWAYETTVLSNEGTLAVIAFPRVKCAVELLQILKDNHLTEKEIEIALAMSKGLSNNDLACQFSISQATLKTHINHIYKKLGMRKVILGRG